MPPRLILGRRNGLDPRGAQLGVASIAGSLTMLYASLAPDGEPPDVRLIVYTPADADTARRLRRLGD
jgi:hypothetical protein